MSVAGPLGAPVAASPTDGAADPWTVLRVIRWSAGYLQDRGVESGRLDAEHLLAHALDTTRLQLYLQFDRPLAPDELADFKPLLRRRAGREPLQYIVGRAAFRELDLFVDRRVLIPRPETETLVQLVLDWAAPRHDLTALDVGTGSGCIALSLLLEGPFGTVVATDIDRDALAVAQANADSAGAVGLRLREGAAFGALAPGERFDVIVSNPPYIAEAEAPGLQPEVRDWEPRAALFGGTDGLAIVWELAHGAADHLAPRGLLALEMATDQAPVVREQLIATGRFGSCRVHRDLTGRPRFVVAQTT